MAHSVHHKTIYQRITRKRSLFMFDIYLPSNPEVIACKLLINFKEIKQKLQPEELDI